MVGVDEKATGTGCSHSSLRDVREMAVDAMLMETARKSVGFLLLDALESAVAADGG
jgi:hypothetical protein